MANNNEKITLSLDTQKTVAQINADIKKLQNQLKKIQATGALDNPSTVKRINSQILALQSQLKTIHINASINTDDVDKTARQIGDALDALKETAQADTLNPNLEAANASIGETNEKLAETTDSMRGLGRLGTFFHKQMSQASEIFSKWFSLSSTVTLLISKTKSAITELKTTHTLLTEISKANDRLSKSDLDRMGSQSFDIASRYGVNPTAYLSGIQEASRAGYENAEGIAELSLALQSAGNMTAELANRMIAATDQAYQMSGSVSDLTRALDGMNHIASHNALSMTEISGGMSIVGSTAASFGVGIDEAAAALGTLMAATRQSGSESANALKAILLSIRQISDEKAGINAESLASCEKACNALNVKLKETRNGMLSLRDPMEVLGELAAMYNRLDDADVRKANLLDSVGGQLYAGQLDTLLRQWDTYEGMLQQYADGTGSMAEAAEKTADSWEGSLNRLSNTWTDTVGNIADSDAIITAINGLNGLLSVVNDITKALGSFGTIGLGAGLFAGVKNIGECRISIRIPKTVFCFGYALHA